MGETRRGSYVYNSPSAAAGNIQQHFPSVYLCTYNIVSLLWASHSCTAIHHMTNLSFTLVLLCTALTHSLTLLTHLLTHSLCSHRFFFCLCPLALVSSSFFGPTKCIGVVSVCFSLLVSPLLFHISSTGRITFTLQAQTPDWDEMCFRERWLCYFSFNLVFSLPAFPLLPAPPLPSI